MKSSITVSAVALPTTRPAVRAEEFRSPELREAQRTLMPQSTTPHESRPQSALNDIPVANPRAASLILGISVELPKKWRQRRKGPDYIQYGPGGPVRYEVRALLEFRELYKVQLNSLRLKRRTIKQRG